MHHIAKLLIHFGNADIIHLIAIAGRVFQQIIGRGHQQASQYTAHAMTDHHNIVRGDSLPVRVKMPEGFCQGFANLGIVVGQGQIGWIVDLPDLIAIP